MKRMYILLVVLLSLGSGILAQSRFAVGFEAGYKDGWCYDRGVGCLPPLPPIIDLAGRIERPLTKYSVKAIVYQEKGDIISAYNNYYECLSYDENNKEIKEELNILSEVINIKFNEAIQKREFNKALWIGRTIENTIFSYSLQGYVYYVMRDFYEAKKFFKKIKSQSKYAKEMLKTIKKEEKEEN